MKKIDILTITAAILMMISALCGLFYTFGGESYEVITHTGLSVSIFGDGIYKNDTIMKVATTKGTDIAMIIISFLIIFTVFMEKQNIRFTLLKTGLLSALVYNSLSLSMGLAFNRLFLLYLFILSTSFFSLIKNINICNKSIELSKDYITKSHTGSAIFLMIAGCSVLVWLMFIIPAIISGNPHESIETLEIYTTEPTFVIDLGIIFPTCMLSAIGILRKQKFAFYLSSVLYIILSCIGLCVIMQTVVQIQFGIILEIGQYIGLAGSFIILGTISIILYLKINRAIISQSPY